jgi:hypothetical protein
MTPDNETETKAPTNDAEFVAMYAAKMEADEKAAAEGKAPAKKEPAPARDPDDDEDEDEVDDDAEVDAEPGADDDDDDDDAVDDDEPEDGADDVDEDDKAAKDEKKKVDDEPDASDTEFDRIAKSLRLPTRFDDLPKEAQPIVERRLRDMTAGFSRVMQQATEFRAKEREFRSEQRYREAHPAEYLAQALVEHPELEEQVATLLEKFRDEDPSQREAATVLEQKHRDDAAREIAAAEKAEREQSEWLATRADEVETLARSACTKAGISFDRGVEAAIAYEIRDTGDIDNARIKELVDEMAQERGRSTRAFKREERKREIQAKTAARKNASPLRPGTGRSGGASKPAAKELTLEQNMMAFTERHFPGEP